MKTLELILKPEHTGKNNYASPSTCPIACALRDAGYKYIGVGSMNWHATKYVLGFIPIVYKGKIPKETDNIAMYIAEHKEIAPVKIKLFIN